VSAYAARQQRGQVFFIMDPKLKRWYYVSPAFERVWGRSPEMLNRKPTTSSSGSIPRRARVFEDLARVATGAPVSTEFRSSTATESSLGLGARIFPLTTKMKDPPDRRKLHDITERKDLEHQLGELGIRPTRRTGRIGVPPPP